MKTITILRIVLYFHVDIRVQSKDLVEVGSSVCSSRGCEQEQYLRIPDSIRRSYKGSIVDARGLNHDDLEVQSVTAVQRFRSSFAGNRWQYICCTPLYFVCPCTKQSYRANCPLRLADSCSFNVRRRAYT